MLLDDDQNHITPLNLIFFMLTMLFHLIEKLKPFQPIYLHVEPNEQTRPNSAYWHLQYKELCISNLRNILKVVTLSTISVLVGLVAGYRWRSLDTTGTTHGKIYCK